MTARRLLSATLALAFFALAGASAQDKKDTKQPGKKLQKKTPNAGVPPTAANVAYGPLERQVLDFWQAKSDKPTPVVFCIHGGGWIERRQEQLLRQRQDVPRRRHFGGHHQLPAHEAGQRGEGRCRR